MSFVDPETSQGWLDLRESEADADPVTQFDRWWHEALAAGVRQPEAMTLATCTRDGVPSARMVLLRGFDQRGFVFYTNYTSRKGRELADNPSAALVLFWEALERQVRIEGRVEKTAAEESDAYYASRPRGSRLGAWASPQSQVLNGREELEQLVREVDARYGVDGPVPRPPYWGGFRVVPQVIEFWQGRQNRLHDRLRYRKDGARWLRERLAP